MQQPRLNLAAELAPEQRPDSDYGSDLSGEEEDIVLRILENIEGSESLGLKRGLEGGPTRVVWAGVEGATIAADVHTSWALQARAGESLVTGDGNGVGSRSVGHAAVACHGQLTAAVDKESIRAGSLPVDGIQYPDLSHALAKLEPAVGPAPFDLSEYSYKTKEGKEDTRPPIERFRTWPKKPLSVTDLTSAAWCELQYWYILTRMPGGQKTRTAAMRAGTKVHKNLEKQVHTTVPVNLASKEEGFALRLWNLVQGLRTLRRSGLTRELEVWGILEGQVVIGVVDEVSYTCPVLSLEQDPGQEPDKGERTQKQPSITTYFGSNDRRVYLTDVKTRDVDKMQSGAASRPAKVQLFLYYRFLADMAAGKLDFAAVMARYGLNAESIFSDAFMAQIGDIHDDIFDDAETRPEERGQMEGDGTEAGEPTSSHDATGQQGSQPGLMGYRSIQQMLLLVHRELRDTFPRGADSLARLLTVQYRHRADGHMIGTQVFSFDGQVLEQYLKLNMAWWKGERRAEGVPIEEAYKCRTCEFVDSCEWREAKQEEFTRNRKRRTKRSKNSERDAVTQQ